MVAIVTLVAIVFIFRWFRSIQTKIDEIRGDLKELKRAITQAQDPDKTGDA